MSGIVPNLSVIAALADNRVIGVDNRLPWRLPADLQHFKKVTMGKPMIMGRKTWESLPGLLPGRPHVVITRDAEYRAEGAQVVHSLQQALELYRDADELMLVGGANLYGQAIPLAARMYLTHVHASPEGDAFFPDFDASHWREIGREEGACDEKNTLSHTFVTLQRVG